MLVPRVKQKDKGETMDDELLTQEMTIAQIRKKIAAIRGETVDVYYQEGIGTRGSKIKNAIIGPAYERFFEITVNVIDGAYKMTINYTDVYTHACQISPCGS